MCGASSFCDRKMKISTRSSRVLILPSGRQGRLVFQADLVGYKSYEFGICGFAFAGVYGVAEVAVQRVDVAPVPGDLDRVADSSFNARGRGFEFLCYSRVQ